MSVSYWGDKFYGINRSEHSELFDDNKERAILIDILKKHNIKDEQIEEFEEDYNEIEFLYLNEISEFFEVELENFNECLNGDIAIYSPNCCNDTITFFGVDFILPWEVKKITTQEEVNRTIYESILPILKDDVTFEKVSKNINVIVINGEDDYISYYEL